jgi:hypothetical protein
MPARYAQLDGRHFVNAEFMDAVRQLYPATTKKIPLGYSTYTGWTGLDEVLFTEHGEIEEIKEFGPLYEVTWQPASDRAFMDHILDKIKHSSVQKDVPYKGAPRRRLSSSEDLKTRWGSTLSETEQRRSLEHSVAEGTRRQARALRAIVAAMRREETGARTASTPDEWISWDPSE